MSLKKKGGKPSQKPRTEEFLSESDEHFAYIVGYTAGGAPYGITWEEAEEIEARDAEIRAKQLPAQKCPVSLKELVDSMHMVNDICTVLPTEHRRIFPGDR